MKAEILKDDKALAVIEETKIAKKTGAEIMQTFAQYSQRAIPLAEEGRALEIDGIEDTENMERARRIRLDLREIRVEADHKRKELKEEALRYNKTVQSVFNILEADIKGTEQVLLDKEKYVEREAEKAAAKLRAERQSKADRYADFIPQHVDLAMLSEQEFEVMLKGAKAMLKEQEEENARAAEKARVEQLKTERMISEGRYQKFWSPDDWARIGTMDPDEYKKKAQEAIVKYKAEEDRNEAERKRVLELEAKAAEERKAREKAENEAKAAQERANEEAKKRREAEAAKKVAETQAQIVTEQKPEPVKKTKAAPKRNAASIERDWSDLVELAEVCRNMRIPKCKTAAAENCRQAVEGLLNKVANFIEERKKAELS